MNQEIGPPFDLFRAQMTRMNFDNGRRGGLPITEEFDQTEMKYRVGQEFFGNCIPPSIYGFKSHLWSKRKVGGYGKSETGREVCGSYIKLKTFVAKDWIVQHTKKISHKEAQN